MCSSRNHDHISTRRILVSWKKKAFKYVRSALHSILGPLCLPILDSHFLNLETWQCFAPLSCVWCEEFQHLKMQSLIFLLVVYLAVRSVNCRRTRSPRDDEYKCPLHKPFLSCCDPPEEDSQRCRRCKLQSWTWRFAFNKERILIMIC